MIMFVLTLCRKKGLMIFLSLLLLSCHQQDSEDTSSEFTVNYEKFVLNNGLEVIFHTDRSDPVVAVALMFHVGSAREKEGKTGFAHLFEHLLFLESENLGKGGLDKLSSRVGGSGANGFTTHDRTAYYQTVPNDALEKMLWAEADKLGFFINTVTEPVVAKEKQVVKNEKRQSVDNRPYGHTSYVIDKHLYPQEHPYNWQVIGSLEDLQNATLADVKEFYAQWYVPNNATLVVAGDFDTAQAKTWVKKYFSEIKKGKDIPQLEKRPGWVGTTQKLYYEDNFARLPDLTMTWPGVPQFDKDSYPLMILSSLLSEGKKSPFYQVIVEEKQLAPDVDMYSDNSELAGQFVLDVRAFPDTDLDTVSAAVQEAFARFEKNGFTEDDLKRVKAGMETDFYMGLSSVLGKAFQLAEYNIIAGDPGFIQQDIQNILSVTKEDVMRVYQQYIKDKPLVITSFVPKGEKVLALEGSSAAEVVEEKIVPGAEESFDLSKETTYERTPSSFDRTIEPPYGKTPQVKIPEVWQGELSNGMQVYGIQNKELPLVFFNIDLKGGLLLDNPDKVGVAHLMAELMTKGTKNKTPEALEEAIQSLGAEIHVEAQQEKIAVSGRTLARNYDSTIALVQEMLLQPRWDQQEFTLAKQSTLSQLEEEKAEPNAIAGNYFNQLLYGKDNILSHDILGTSASVEGITLDDLKAYYAANLSPAIATMHIMGDIGKEEVMQSLNGLEGAWKNDKQVKLPTPLQASAPESSKVYFYDVPDAKQSVLRFGYLAMPETDSDYYPASVMNYKLGGGGFASELTQALREGKGYTYGIRSYFDGSTRPGPFIISSGVRSNVTYEASSLVKDILKNYPESYDSAALAVTKSYTIKSSARAFETPYAKLNMLEKISDYDWSPDYVKERQQIVEDMTVNQVKELARKYADPDHMIYLIVGDAATQLKPLEKLGYGKPVLLNE